MIISEVWKKKYGYESECLFGKISDHQIIRFHKIILIAIGGYLKKVYKNF